MKKVIKAWAVLDVDNTLSHITERKDDADTWENYTVVPCIVMYSYSLPKEKKEKGV